MQDGNTGTVGVLAIGRHVQVVSVLAEHHDAAVLVFAFDCVGRRGRMGGKIDKALQAMKDTVGKTPVLGFYGSGETGPKDNDSAPCVVQYHIVICGILNP